MVSLFTLFSCEKEDDNLGIKSDSSASNKLELVEGTIQINSKASLKNIVASYQKDVTEQNKFNDRIRKLQDKGFKPLTPIFEIDDTEKIQKFISDKKNRLQKTYKSLGISSKIAEEEIDLDDNLIADPVLAGLLNEDREIVVADSLYKYTEMGMYFCLNKDKQKLYDYLNNLTPSQKQSQIANRFTHSKQTSKSSIALPVELVSDGINLFTPIVPFESETELQTLPSADVVLSSTSTPTLVKQNLPITWIEKQGFFEKIFGTRETKTESFGDGKRVKVAFWNQNFFIFSSVGSSVKFQKRAKFLGVAYWDKSYAEKIEMGINNITYKYKFNVPQYNNTIYATQGSVFYSYKGVNYNQFGMVVPQIPANPGFPFNTDDNRNVVEIYIHTLGYDLNYDLSATAANKIIDEGLKSLVNSLPFSNPAKAELDKGLNDGSLKYNVLKAVPFEDKVTFSTMGVRWTNNNDNAVIKYFDFNFLLTWKSSYSNVGTYLTGLNGATPYTISSADIYGAALHNGQWKGRRLMLK